MNKKALLGSEVIAPIFAIFALSVIALFFAYVFFLADPGKLFAQEQEKPGTPKIESNFPDTKSYDYLNFYLYEKIQIDNKDTSFSEFLPLYCYDGNYKKFLPEIKEKSLSLLTKLNNLNKEFSGSDGFIYLKIFCVKKEIKDCSQAQEKIPGTPFSIPDYSIAVEVLETTTSKSVKDKELTLSEKGDIEIKEIEYEIDKEISSIYTLKMPGVNHENNICISIGDSYSGPEVYSKTYDWSEENPVEELEYKPVGK